MQKTAPILHQQPSAWLRSIGIAASLLVLFFIYVFHTMVGHYPMGLYKVKNTWQFTSRGVGTVPPRARFNCRPEIVVLELRAQG